MSELCDEKPRGYLSVRVHEGHLAGYAHEPDSYVKLSMRYDNEDGSGEAVGVPYQFKEVQRSSAISGSSKPAWNQTFEFEIYDDGVNDLDIFVCVHVHVLAPELAKKDVEDLDMFDWVAGCEMMVNGLLEPDAAAVDKQQFVLSDAKTTQTSHVTLSLSFSDTPSSEGKTNVANPLTDETYVADEISDEQKGNQETDKKTEVADVSSDDKQEEFTQSKLTCNPLAHSSDDEDEAHSVADTFADAASPRVEEEEGKQEEDENKEEEKLEEEKEVEDAVEEPTKEAEVVSLGRQNPIPVKSYEQAPAEQAADGCGEEEAEVQHVEGQGEQKADISSAGGKTSLESPKATWSPRTSALDNAEAQLAKARAQLAAMRAAKERNVARSNASSPVLGAESSPPVIAASHVRGVVPLLDLSESKAPTGALPKASPLPEPSTARSTARSSEDKDSSWKPAMSKSKMAEEAVTDEEEEEKEIEPERKDNKGKVGPMTVVPSLDLRAFSKGAPSAKTTPQNTSELAAKPEVSPEVESNAVGKLTAASMTGSKPATPTQSASEKKVRRSSGALAGARRPTQEPAPLLSPRGLVSLQGIASPRSVEQGPRVAPTPVPAVPKPDKLGTPRRLEVVEAITPSPRQIARAHHQHHHRNKNTVSTPKQDKASFGPRLSISPSAPVASTSPNGFKADPEEESEESLAQRHKEWACMVAEQLSRLTQRDAALALEGIPVSDTGDVLEVMVPTVSAGIVPHLVNFVAYLRELPISQCAEVLGKYDPQAQGPMLVRLRLEQQQGVLKEINAADAGAVLSHVPSTIAGKMLQMLGLPIGSLMLLGMMPHQGASILRAMGPEYSQSLLDHLMENDLDDEVISYYYYVVASAEQEQCIIRYIHALREKGF